MGLIELDVNTAIETFQTAWGLSKLILAIMLVAGAVDILWTLKKKIQSGK